MHHHTQPIDRYQPVENSTIMIEQTIIALCGMASIWLANDPRESWRRWACIIGLVAQPFWMYATFKAAQWGIFALSFVYAAGWARGVRHYWIRRGT